EVPERRDARRLVPDALQPHRRLLAARELQRDRRAEAQVVVLDVVLAREEAVQSELARDGVAALRPLHLDALVQIRLDGGQVVVAPQVARRARTNRRDVVDLWLADERLAGL